MYLLFPCLFAICISGEVFLQIQADERFGQYSNKKTNVDYYQFSNDVDNLLRKLDEKYAMTDSIKNAEQKIEAIKKAGILIHLFTNSDEKEKLPAKTFYRTLNEELRSGKRDSFWLKCEELLNLALDIIGHESFEFLFRGERCCKTSVPDNILEGSSFKVLGFWSTTLDPSSEFFDFGAQEYAFYIIKNVKGVNVENFSVTNLEKEVLIQSSREYVLEKNISERESQLEVLKEVKKLFPKFDPNKFHPENIFILVPIKYDPKKDVTIKDVPKKDVPIKDVPIKDAPIKDDNHHDEL